MNQKRVSGLPYKPTRFSCAEARRITMRIVILAALAGAGLAGLSLPAAAVPAGPVVGVSSPSDMRTDVRMRRHHMRRPAMTWVQRRRSRH
jgi:hypothetical protein